MMVKRDLNIFGKKEKITEYYDQKKGEIKIVKTAKTVTVDQVIKKVPPIENIYGFIYRYRQNGDFKDQEESFNLHLPTKDITIKNFGKKKLRMDKNEEDTFYMQSDPRQYSIWFASGKNKIPLRIDGAVGLNQTSMILNEYKPGI